MTAKAIAWTAALFLWGIFLLEFELPLMFAFAVCVFLFGVLFVAYMDVDAIAFLVIANLLYWIYSGILVGSVDPGDLHTLRFINGDGRIFITYLPLLLFSVMLVRHHAVSTLLYALTWIAAASVILYFVWLATGSSTLSEGGGGHYVGFLTSHTGAGTFFGLLCIFLVIYGYNTGNRAAQSMGLLMALPLFGSASREALVAALAVAVWYMIRVRRLRPIVATLLLGAISTASMPILAPQTWQRTVSILDWSLVETAVLTAETSDWEPGTGDPELLGKEHNVLSRVVFWTYAAKRFSESPIIGIGFGRYNDSQLQMKGTPGAFYVATGGVKNFSVSSAHNSYLHMLCETGVVGLALLLWLWAAIYLRLRRAAREFASRNEAYAFFVACQGSIIFILVCALTGHALAAPSIGVPVATLVSIAMAYHRYLRRAPGEISDSRVLQLSLAGS